MKTCTKCDEEKPLSEFHKDASRRDGLCCWCKTCVGAYQRKYNARHREKINARQRRYRAEQPAKTKSREMLCKYGITLSDYAAMLEAQGGKCALCRRKAEDLGKPLVVDHNHETAKVRGLLCYACNTALGLLQDNPEMCDLAALYLRQFAGSSEPS